MSEKTLKRLELSAKDLDSVIRRLGRDHNLVGSNGPLVKAYQAIVNAWSDIERHVEHLESADLLAQIFGEDEVAP